MICGLLGRVLGHSYSPLIHQMLGSYQYDLFPTEPENLESFLKKGDFTGLNVTIPYKKAVIPYCAELSDRSKAVGAVNTIIRRPDGHLIGHNTDYFGFSVLLKDSRISVSGKKVLVLGSGGASNVAVAVLNAAGADTVVISRTGPDNYQNLERHKDASLIVNTTPLGMYPNTGISPVDLEQFPYLEGVLDAVYNPARTQILLEAEKRGLVAKNGLKMLVAQAKESAEWFTGVKIPHSKIDEIYNILSRQMENIILIGMPGCGKSTVGALLAEKTGRSFVDADQYLSDKYGRTIPDIFASEGEESFRAKETDILRELGMRSGIVLATGGGCVTKQCNYPLLHQNGRIFWLKREIDRLPCTGRPLSQKKGLVKIYDDRQALYSSFADFSADNNRDPNEAAMEIISMWEALT